MHSFQSEVVLRPSPLHSKALVSDASSSRFLYMRGQLTDSDDDSDSELNLAAKVTESADALATVRAALGQYRDIERVHTRPMNTQTQLGAGIVHYD